MLRPIQTVKKVCVLGPAGVGKSSLVAKLLDAQAPLTSTPTSSPVVSRKALEVFPPAAGFQGINATLLLFDLPAEQLEPRLRQTYYTGAEGAVVVADGTDATSLQQSIRWIADFRAVVGPKPIALLANKVDRLAIADLAARERIPAYLRETYGGVEPHPVSALTGHGVFTSFQALAQRIVTANPF